MKVACTLLPYIDFRYGVLPLAGGRAHNRIAPRSEILSATARAALDIVVRFKLGRSRVYAAHEGDFCNIRLVFKQIAHNLYHALHRHRLLGDYQRNLQTQIPRL